MTDTPAAARPRHNRRIAVIALQGDFERHIHRLRDLGADPFAARTPDEVAASDAIVIPGGESTTIGKLMVRYGLDSAIRDAHTAGKPIFGTCAGVILIAREIEESTQEHGGQPSLRLLDVTVARNAYGRQIDSFEDVIDAPDLVGPGEPQIPGVFIRPPAITRCGAGVEVLGRHDGKPVLVRAGNVLGATFHPELTDDTRIHGYFLAMTPSEA